MGSPSTPIAYKDRRTWLAIFGVIEILIACFFLLMAVVMVGATRSIRPQPGQPPMPQGFFYVVAVFYGLIAGYFITVGIGSMRAKNWARIAMLAISWIWLVIGVFSVAVLGLLMPTIFRQQQAEMQRQGLSHPLPPEFYHSLLVITLAFQVVVMVILPLVFIIFYTSKNVKATCLGDSAIRLGTGSNLPVPLLILLGWAILGLLGAVVAMWLNIALIMSVVVKGIAARAVFGLYGIAYAYSIHGIYKRKIEGWWAALFLASFGSVSTLISHLRTDPIQFYREFGQEWAVPQTDNWIHIMWRCSHRCIRIPSLCSLLSQVLCENFGRA